MTRVNNVLDKRAGWIGSWDTEPLVVGSLTKADVGRTVIYQDHGRAEAGTLVRWDRDTVWARYHQGDTAAAAPARSVVLAVRQVPVEEMLR